MFNRPSIFVSVLWIVAETSLSEAETAAASLLRVRDGGLSSSPVRVGSFLTSPRWSPVRVGSFLAIVGDVAPMGASSLFLSVVFSAPSGAFSRAFFFLAFLGFLSSNLRTSSFSFCFADLRGAS